MLIVYFYLKIILLDFWNAKLLIKFFIFKTFHILLSIQFRLMLEHIGDNDFSFSTYNLI
jgi:hypothetical protein